LRLKQFKKYEDDEFKLTFSKSIVAGKIKNSLTLIRQFAYNHPDLAFETEISALTAGINQAEESSRIVQLLSQP